MHKWQPGNKVFIVNGRYALHAPELESTTIKRVETAYVDLENRLAATGCRMRVYPGEVFPDARSAWLAYAEKMDAEAMEHEEKMNAAKGNSAEARQRAESA